MMRLFGEQRYECVGIKPYTRRDGSQTELLIWRSNCAKCGDSFECTSPAQSENFSPNRRCALHKRPGTKVKSLSMRAA